MKRRLISCIAAFAVFGATFAGCSSVKVEPLKNDNYYITEKGEPAKYATLSFDYLGGADVMPIGGFYGPYNSGGSIDGYQFPQLVDDKYFSLIAEAGLNMIVYSADVQEASVMRSLELGEKYGIGQFANVAIVDTLVRKLRNEEPLSKAYRKGDPLPFDTRELYESAKRLFSYDSLLGIRGDDEPFWYQLDGLAEVSRMVREIGHGDMQMYVNALGYGGGDLTYGGWRENITQEQYFE